MAPEGVELVGICGSFPRRNAGPLPQSRLRRFAEVARKQHLNLGCHCPPDEWCHRSILRELLIDLVTDAEEVGAEGAAQRERYFSPACSMPEIED